MIRVKTDDISNGEPDKFTEWKWFTKDELQEAHDDIYDVDKWPVNYWLSDKSLT